MPKHIETCSFCGKTKEEVNKLIASETSAICDECIDKCGLILKDDTDSNKKQQETIKDVDPHDIKQFFDKFVIGQDAAKEQVAVSVFLHYKRLNHPGILEKYVEVPEKINCYAEDFFHYFSGDKPEELRVHYLADSNHQWKYGHPLHIDYYDLPQKMQLLTHPYSWSEEGYDNISNYTKLIRERNAELLTSMDSETKTFPRELLI